MALVNDLKRISEQTGHTQFVIGGSWAAMKIAEAAATICKDDDDYDDVNLNANDCDMYYGTFTTDSEKSLVVKLNCIAYQAVDSFDWEVNTVECDNVSPLGFLENNDLNITACCFHVNVKAEQILSIHASPCFWQFLFQKKSERKIRTVNTADISKYGPTTCVRMAYKAFEMGFPFSFGGIDPTVGTIASSQKKKIDEMTEWPNSPFHEYQCNQCRSHFVIAKKHKKIKCSKCLTRLGNTACSSKMCKQCCLDHNTIMLCKTHGKK